MSDQNGGERRHRIVDLDERALGPNVTPSQLASYWNVHYDTVLRDIRKGALRAFRLPGGQIRIRTKDARSYGRPIE